MDNRTSNTRGKVKSGGALTVLKLIPSKFISISLNPGIPKVEEEEVALPKSRVAERKEEEKTLKLT